MLVCDRGPSLATTPDIAAPVTPAWKLGLWKIQITENNNMFEGENFYRRMEKDETVFYRIKILTLVDKRCMNDIMYQHL